MPPKITDSRPSAEAIHEVEEQTALGARRIVATYAEDLMDGVTLMSMLGVEPEGLVYKRFEEELSPQEETPEEAAAKTATKKKATKKKATKKTTKKTTKKVAKKASPAAE
ncbi:hypothetical protein [Corynebacterium lubricantis]|uniref:hypothetical protein n=1 Tax=Corynebacterium lubricantis TaxID=541095 RepID=UPI00037EDB36|nr:hypothetical protein [Corynebacterium lubricantis]